MKLAIYPQGWDYRETCPCDGEFVDWMENVVPSRIFHMGTGNHHLVGRSLSMRHDVYGLTASPEEVQTYLDFAQRDVSLSRRYQVLFSDIHVLNFGMLPKFNIVTLFHLGEDYAINRPADYPASSENAILLYTYAVLESDGVLILYKGSSAYWKAIAALQPLIKEGLFFYATEYKHLSVFKRLG